MGRVGWAKPIGYVIRGTAQLAFWDFLAAIATAGLRNLSNQVELLVDGRPFQEVNPRIMIPTGEKMSKCVTSITLGVRSRLLFWPEVSPFYRQHDKNT